MDTEKATATARFQKIAPSKARLVLDTVRGRPVGEAMSRLKFMPNRAARVVEKVLGSAVANAEDRGIGDVDRLVVSAGWVNQGPTQKRSEQRAQGRTNRILKRTSHVTVVVAPSAKA